MNGLLDYLGDRNLVVTAHPDDETLWGGGLLAKYPRSWTVICCSIPRADPIRANKFFHACRVLEVRGELVPFSETEFGEHLPDIADEWDCIVTHGAKGEYGHPHHKAVHEHVLAGAKCPVIAYAPDGGQFTLTLSDADHHQKMAALRCYDHCLPYGNLGNVPKWQALLHRYGEADVWWQEHYDVLNT